MCGDSYMPFEPDRRFESLEDAFTFLLDQQVRRPVERLWTETPSGVVAPHEVPSCLFRGECGLFETTMSSIHKPDMATLGDGRRLSVPDLRALQQLILGLVDLFVHSETYALNEHQAYGLLQHYRLPTTIIDFTGDLTNAFVFAAAGRSTVGRLAVLDLPKALERVIDFTDHPWAERALRQAAFGVVPPDGIIDLKSDAGRSRLGLRWYEFPVTPADREFFGRKSQ